MLLRPAHENMLETLTIEQYVYPHESLAQALSNIAMTLGIAPATLQEHAARHGFDTATAIGRLRRIDLTRLSAVLKQG